MIEDRGRVMVDKRGIKRQKEGWNKAKDGLIYVLTVPTDRFSTITVCNAEHWKADIKLVVTTDQIMSIIWNHSIEQYTILNQSLLIIIFLMKLIEDGIEEKGMKEKKKGFATIAVVWDFQTSMIRWWWL